MEIAKTQQVEYLIGGIDGDLEMMAQQMNLVLQRCNEIRQDEGVRHDQNRWRDVEHLRARVEATARQLDGTRAALERLMQHFSGPFSLSPCFLPEPVSSCEAPLV